MTADAKGLSLTLIIVVDKLHLVGDQVCQLNFLIPTTYFFNVALRMDGDGGIEMVSMSGAIQDKIWEFRDITMFVTRQNEMSSVLWWQTSHVMVPESRVGKMGRQSWPLNTQRLDNESLDSLNA